MLRMFVGDTVAIYTTNVRATLMLMMLQGERNAILIKIITDNVVSKLSMQSITPLR